MDKLVFEGMVKAYQKQIFIIDDHDESVYTWIHKSTKDWVEKKVRITLEKLEEEGR